MEHFLDSIPYESRVRLPRFQTKSGIYAIDLQQIMYLSARSNYTVFHLKNGEHVITSLSLNIYTSLLEEKGFMRIHKSYLINLYYVDQCQILRFEVLTLPTGQSITIARRRRTALKNRLNDLSL